MKYWEIIADKSQQSRLEVGVRVIGGFRGAKVSTHVTALRHRMAGVLEPSEPVPQLGILFNAAARARGDHTESVADFGLPSRAYEDLCESVSGCRKLLPEPILVVKLAEAHGGSLVLMNREGSWAHKRCCAYRSKQCREKRPEVGTTRSQNRLGTVPP
jgi:hypothetical protein